MKVKLSVRVNHGPVGPRVGRTYDGLILAELIGGGRDRQTDRRGAGVNRITTANMG